MTTLTTTASNASTPTKFFTVAQLPEPVGLQLAVWERDTMHHLAPGVVAVSRPHDDPDAEILEDLTNWLGTTGATVAGPFTTLQLAAASLRHAA